MIIESMTFRDLVCSIKKLHDQLAHRASKAVNMSLSIRNWIIGYYIREYEQNGKDRAEYGEHILNRLSNELQESLDHCYTERYFRLCRQFYESYPQIRKSLISTFGLPKNGKSPISEFPVLKNGLKLEKERPEPQLAVSGDMIVERLSFTHIVELMKIGNIIKRNFYEIECMRGNWSVRELKRQITSLYFERSGLSKNKEKLADLAHSSAEIIEPKLAIRDPYVFEFLGLKPCDVMTESNLEDALLDKLQEFLLEMGHGFCFEARQKRILIGDEYFFVDLVFYHRILKCHVLVELKLDKFTHEHLGQLNTYLSWYKKNQMIEGDNLPVGILLCSEKNHALVEYALAGIDNQLFISMYQLELPAKEEMQRFLEREIARESETACQEVELE